jgi:hypothetical protein
MIKFLAGGEEGEAHIIMADLREASSSSILRAANGERGGKGDALG